MSLTVDDLVQVKNYLINEGLRQAVVSERKEDYLKANFIPSVGEFYYLLDKDKLYFSKGASLNKGSIIPHLNQINLKDDDLHQLALKLWDNLDKLMVLGEKRDFIFKNPILESFIKTKPDKFSFLKGEKPLDGSLFDRFGDGKGLEPDIRGAFARNMSQESNKDDEKRLPGDYQDDALQNHIHKSVVVSIGKEHSNKAGDWGGSAWPVSNVWGNMGDTSNVQGNNIKTNKDETRPKNYCVISVVKVLP